MYKDHLLNNYQKIFMVKNLLDTMDTTYFTTTIINQKPITPSTISIVMTASNRTNQTYFTLDTINKSTNKDIHIIIVDDSTHDPIQIDKLQLYNIHMELITIKNKFWVNPCVNYNIGFKHIKGSKVIIQNAEVCHMDDILNYTLQINNNEYHAFNVYALHDKTQNTTLQNNYPSDITTLKGMWYQHPQHRNTFYHFVIAITIETFNKIGGFDIDYSIGIDYDDNALVHRVKNNAIKLINVPLLGVHQWHEQSNCGSTSSNISNLHLWHCKNNFHDKYKTFLDLTNYPIDIVPTIINDNL
jgi:GT2 family glycosyltransferase